MNAFTLRMIAIAAAVLYGLSFVVFDMNTIAIVIGALIVAALFIAAATLARGDGAGAERQRLRAERRAARRG